MIQFKKKKSLLLFGALFSVTLLVGTQNNYTEAATFTKAEKQQVESIQSRYNNLDKTPINAQTLYQDVPSLIEPFQPGKLPDSYISNTIAYINYYRDLFGLPAITSLPEENSDAQLTASIMAAAQATPFKNQHGLPNATKPDFVSDDDWKIAQQVSNSSNLNFNIYDQSAGDVITDLVRDNYNLTGNDTGHRAWLLSSRISKTGIGAAYGSNGFRYFVQPVMYGNDIFKQPSKSTVTYPSSTLFPIEMINSRNTPWSIYLSDKAIFSTPKITVKDVDTGQVVDAQNVSNYSQDQFGNFHTIITFSPGDLPLVSTHEYYVEVEGVYSYNFKLFNQVAANQPEITLTDEEAVKKPTSTTNPTTTPAQTKPTAQTPKVEISPNEFRKNLMKKAEFIRDSLESRNNFQYLVFGRSYQDGNDFYNLGDDQWFKDFFEFSNPDIKAGLIDISSRMLDRQVYTSPYPSQRESTYHFLNIGETLPYGQTITVGQEVWYYLGPKQWVKQISQ